LSGDVLDGAQEGPLHLEVLGHRLDDHATAGEIVQPVDDTDAGEDGVGVGPVETAAGDVAVEPAREIHDGPARRLGAGVVQPDGVAGAGGDLGDPGAHRACPDHGDVVVGRDPAHRDSSPPVALPAVVHRPTLAQTPPWARRITRRGAGPVRHWPRQRNSCRKRATVAS
jgi:hypothetical protein